MARRSTPNIVLHIAASKHSRVYLHLCLLVALKVIRIELLCNPVKALFDFGFCILSCIPYGLYLMYLMCYAPLWKLIDVLKDIWNHYEKTKS